MLMALLPGTALAEEDVLSSPDMYTDVTISDAMSYLQGSGTVSDPFQIWNADDLYYINYIEYWNGLEALPQTYHYRQMGPLDLSSSSRFDRATGYITANFGGVYDGGGYTITGMTKPLFYFTRGSYIGDAAGTVFTDYVTGISHDRVFSAIVRNLVIQNPQITQTVASDVIEQIGAVAAYAVNTTFYNIEVRGGNVNGISGAAAIAGRAGSIVIDSCFSDSAIYASMHRAAGIVSNLRIVDAKKGATTTSLVTGCTFSGSISGNLDGERGSAGIVGGVYMDGTSTLIRTLPLYLTNCTFSGSITGTVTSGSGNFGGILGVCFQGPGIYLAGNTVSGSIQGITVAPGATAASVGGVVGKILNYSLQETEPTLILSNNDTSRAILQATDPDRLLYVGTLVGAQNDVNYTLTGPFSISTPALLGEYGSIQAAQLAGEIGDLILPANSSAATFYILPGARMGRLEVNTSNTLNLYNYGTMGDVTNLMGINLYENTGSMGNVVSYGGAVNVGGSSSNIVRCGNEGTIGDITGGTSVTVYRNTGTIGGLTAQASSVTIGQSNNSNAELAGYNLNSGMIGSVDAATTVAVYSDVAGSVAAAEGQTVKSGTTVTVGTASVPNRNNIGKIEAGSSITIYGAEGAAIGDLEANTSVSIGSAAAPNQSAVGNITAGTTVGVYNGETGSVGTVTAGSTVTVGASTSPNAGQVGDIDTDGGVNVYNGSAIIGTIEAGSTVNLYGNAGDIGNVTSSASISVGGYNKTEANAAGQVGNEGEIGSLTAGTSVTVYRNTGTIGDLTSQTTSVSIGQGNNATEAIRTYNANSGTIGSVDAATTVTIHSGHVPSGSVAAEGTVTAGTSVTLGTVSYPNYNTVGAIEAPTVSGYTAVDVGTIRADSNRLVNATAGEGVSVITISGNATLTADENGQITVNGNTYPAGSKLVVNSAATVTISGEHPVTLSAVEANGNLTILDPAGMTRIDSINVVGNLILGNNPNLFAGSVGNITASGSVTLGSSNASYYFTGTVTGDLAATGGVTIYNSGVLGTESAGNTISSATGSISITNGAGHTIYSNVVNNSATSTTSITNNGNPMSGAIIHNGTGALTLSGQNGSARQYTGSISVAQALTIGNNIGTNAETDAVTVNFTGERAVISVANHTFYLKATGENLSSVSVASTATTDARNTVDLSALANTVTFSIAAQENKTAVILPEGASAGTSLGTLVSGTVSADMSGDTYATGNITVNEGVSLSADGTLTVTAASATITNYGTIGRINHTGTGTLTVYNIGANAKIGDVNSAGTVTLGKSNITTATTEVGNEGEIGSITAANTITIYRNTGTIGDLTAQTGAIRIGQGDSAAYAAYNVNSGTIGSVDAATTVYLYGGDVQSGNVAASAGQTITAGSNVNIGTATVPNQNTVGNITTDAAVNVYNGENGSVGGVTAGTTVTIGAAANANAGDVGDISATGNVTVYNGGANLGAIDTAGTVYLYGNAGAIGNVTSTGNSVNVGGSNKTEANAAGQVGNSGTIGNLTGTSVNVYRNTGKIGNLKSTTGAIRIGQGDSAAYAAYNVNSGTVGSVDAATTVAVYSGDVQSGSVAASEGQTIAAGTTVTIGTSTVPNQNAVGNITAGTTVSVYNGESGSAGNVTAGSTVTIGAAANANAGDVGDIDTDGGVSVYNGSATIGTIEAGGAVNLYGNAGTIGNVTSSGNSVNVGSSNRIESTAAGQVGNSGTIGDLTGTSVNVYRNTGKIGGLTATSTSVRVGQSDSSTEGVPAYNHNSGTIGSIDAVTSVTIYSTGSGSIATASGETVEAGTTVTIGTAANPNANDIGAVTSGTTVTLHSGSGTVGSVTAGTSLSAHVYDGSRDLNLITSTGDVQVVDHTTSSAPSVNITTDSGDVRVSRDEDDETASSVNLRANLTVTGELTAGQSLFIRGEFASVVHNGAGDVIMESADTRVTNVVRNSTGEVKVFGSAGNVIEDSTTGYLLSLVPVNISTLDVYLLTTNGSVLDSGDLNLTVANGNFTADPDAVTGGGASEKVGSITVDTSAAQNITVTVSGSYTPDGKDEIALSEASRTLSIPAVLERIDTVFLATAADFAAAQAQYGWDNTTAPASYPVLAVIPLVNEAYTGVTVTVNGSAVNEDGVALIAVDAGQVSAGSVSAAVAASGAGSPSYSGSVTYTLTDVDRAKLDDTTEYYYVTFRYMDALTADQVVPVVKGQSIMLNAPNTRPGYTFLGWNSGDVVYTANTSFTPTQDTTLTAQWGAQSVTHTLTIHVTGRGSVVRSLDGAEYPITSGTSFLQGETVTLLPRRNAGYRFYAWIVNGTPVYDEALTLTMDGDQEVTAVFYVSGSGAITEPVATYDISVGTTSNGTVRSASRATSGSEVIITVTPDAGYQIGSIQVLTASGRTVTVTQRSDGSYVFIMPGEAVRIIAAFVEIPEVPDIPENPENVFTDVFESDYYYDAVLWAVENQITEGTNPAGTLFSPDLDVSRAQMVTFLWRAAGSPAATEVNPFTDVSADDYYYDAVLWAVDNGITQGTGDNLFSPDEIVSRAQAVTFLYRELA